MSGKRFYISRKLYHRLEKLAKIHRLTVDQYATRLLNKYVASEVRGSK